MLEWEKDENEAGIVPFKKIKLWDQVWAVTT